MPNDNEQNQAPAAPTAQQLFAAQVAASLPNTETSTNAKEPKKSNKRLFLILGIIGAVLLVAGGTIAFLLLNNKTSDTGGNNAAVLSTIGDALKSSLEDPSNASVTVYKSNNPATVIQKLEGNVWISADDDSSVLSFSSGRDSQAGNENDYKRVVERVKSAGLVEMKTSAGASVGYDSTNATTRYFSSDDYVCVLRNKPANGVFTLLVDCTLQTSFNDNKTAVLPFVQLYSAKQEVGDKDTLFGKPGIQNSITDKYKTAKIGLYGLDYLGEIASAIFYQTPDEKWRYFMGAAEQDKILCSEYSGEDIVNAFAGATCWDASANASSFVYKDIPTLDADSASKD